MYARHASCLAAVLGLALSSQVAFSNDDQGQILTFEPPVYAPSSSGKAPVLWTEAYRKDGSGFSRFVFGCLERQIVQAAFQLDPKTKHSFAYKAEADPKGTGLGLRYSLNFISDDPFFQKIGGAKEYVISVPSSYPNLQQLTLMHLLVAPGAAKLMGHGWQSMTVSANTQHGEIVRVTIRRDDAQLQAFFDKCQVAS